MSYIDKLIKKLRDETSGQEGASVDLVKWYNWMSFDIIGDLTFGQSFDCLEKETYHPWVEMIFGNLKGLSLLSACNRFPILRHLLPFFIPQSIKVMINDHWTATTENVSRRIELGTERPDFISPILKNMDEAKTSITRDELASNASLFVIAGSESVATILSGTTYFLLRNPALMRELKDEIDATFSSEEQITPQHVSQLPYLNACLAETNRIYPAALTGQAMRVPSSGHTVSGRWIPGGVSVAFQKLSTSSVDVHEERVQRLTRIQTGVSINQYAAYHSPTNFRDPNNYIPKRWLDESLYSSDNKDVFQPFSVGSRNCVGKK